MPLEIPSGPLRLGGGRPGLHIKSGSTAFNPANYGTVAARFPSTSLTALADAAAIASWADTSGNSRNATQALGANQPTKQTVTNNAKTFAVCRCDGVNDTLKTASFTLNQPDTWFVVCKITGAFSSSATVVDGLSAAFTHMLARNSSTDMRIYAGTTLVGTTTPTAWHVYSMQFNGASSQLWADGVSLAAGNAGSSTAGGVSIGESGGQTAACDIADVLVYSGTLSTANRWAVEAALKSLYGTP